MAINMPAKRDLSLDYMKGIGCIMIVMAHMNIYDAMNYTTYLIDNIAELGPIFFFAIAGVTARMQVGKYKLKSILLSYVFMAILGFSFNCLLPHLLVEFWTKIWICEIIQIIALGSILVVLIEHYLKPKIVIYLLLGMAIAGSKFLIDYTIGKDVLPFFMFPPGETYVNSIPVKFPGFTIIPWLWVFPLGVFAYNCKNNINLLIGILFTTALLVCAHFCDNFNLFQKWDMSLEYFLFATAVLFGSFYLVRLFSQLVDLKDNFLSNLGKDSLVLLYVHFVAILICLALAAILPLYFKNQYLLWGIALVLTYIFIRIVRRIKYAKFLATIKSWYILSAAIILMPLMLGGVLLAVDDPFFSFLMKLLLALSEFSMGLLFAKNYSQLSKAVTQRV